MLISSRAAVAAVALVLTIGSGVSIANAGKIYWSEAPNDEALKRANLDGSNIETLVPVVTNGIALDLDAGKIYWGALLSLWRADLDGSNSELLYGSLLFLPGPLALDAAEGWLFTATFIGEGCNGIWRFPADGSGVGEEIVPPQCVDGLAVDVDARKLYWATAGLPGQIGRSDLDGSNVEIVLHFQTQISGLALDAEQGRLYWTELNTPNAVLRADTNGANIEVLVASPENCHAVALDLVADKLYYTLDSPRGEQVIYRAGLDGSNPQPILAVDSTAQIAIDPTPGGGDVPAISPAGMALLVVAMLLMALWRHSRLRPNR